jgi:hypothetical protein
MQEAVPPADHYAVRPGRWVAEAAWPPPSVERRTLPLPGAFPVSHRSVESNGGDAGAWCPDGGSGDWPPDQRAEDERSLTLDLPPLEEGLEILGFPEVELSLSVDRPLALVAVRLCGVAPDGSSLLLTRGLLNLTHRDGQDTVHPLEPGERYDVRVRLDAIAQGVPAGYGLRVAVSTAYWPWAWPSPEPVTLTLHGASLDLPLLRPGSPEPPPFDAPEWAPPLEVETITSGATSRTHRDDPATGEHEVAFEWDVGGHRRLVDSGIEMEDTNRTTYRIVDGDPLSAEVEVRCSSALGRGDWRTRVDTYSHMTSTATEFLVTQRLDGFEGDEQVYTRTWEMRFPRDGV